MVPNRTLALCSLERKFVIHVFQIQNRCCRMMRTVVGKDYSDVRLYSDRLPRQPIAIPAEPAVSFHISRLRGGTRSRVEYSIVLRLPPRALRCAFAGLAAMILAAPGMADVAAGTVLEVRLLTSLSSYRTKTGAEVQGLVVSPGCPDGLPPGTIARGVVKRVHKVGLGLIHESASMDIDFTELRLPDGQKYPLRARLKSVENAREHVNRNGSIRGIRATGSLSNRMSSRILFALDDHPLFLIPLLAVETILFRFPDPEINYGPGTELHLELDEPLDTGVAPLCAATEERARPDASVEFQDLLAAVPYWTYSKQGEPADPTNLIFVGSQEELERAFDAAGWTGSQSISKSSGLQAVRAVAERRGFVDAPMRTLLLDGAEPDIGRQKALNTFTKRHHLRMWKRPEQWQGRTVWASAATRDIAITFSLRSFGFTHQIQSAVDLERDKVVSDLVFTGCVDSVSYSTRPEVARIPEYEGRRGLTTDSRIAVVELNACEAPHQYASPAIEDVPPRLAVRAVRRVTLTVRSHLIRDNIYWKYAEGGWMLFRAVRSLVAGRISEHRAEALARSRGSPGPPIVEPRSGFVGN